MPLIKKARCFIYSQYTLQRNFYSEKRRFLVNHKNATANYDVMLTNFGGTASTTLLTFLKKHHKINHENNRDLLKHAGSPPPSADKAIHCVYLFGDPRMSAASIYDPLHISRRPRLHAHHMQIGLCRPWLTPPAKTLAGYVERNKDLFFFEKQFNNWFNAKPAYPILFLRYDTLWDNLDILFDFLNTPDHVRKDFPRYQPRRNSSAILPPPIVEGLHHMYGRFAERLKTLPDHFVHGAE